MRLQKEKEKQVLSVYNKWLDAYLNGDVTAYNAYLHKDYHFIGSAAQEEFLNRKDATQFFADTGDQFTGKTEIRNDSKVIEQFGELIFITHLLDGWFLNEKEWNYYARFRFTSVLNYTEKGWRIIYQHFSIPDPKTEEGETIGYDKVNEENQELREAIKRRTQELEFKNRALEIEAALGRIRTEAMAMNKSTDLLDIVVTMRNEFTALGLEAHYFWHMMWLQDTYEKAMTSGDGSRIGFVMSLPRHIHRDIPQIADWEKYGQSPLVYTMDTSAAISYVDKMVELGDFRNIDPQAPTHEDIEHIGGLTFIMAKTSHGEIGYSLPGVVEHPPQESLEILKRFANAFDLAHRRFLDLQNAEAQAREAEIEAALERIRSRSMALSQSEDFQEVIQVVYNQFIQLNIDVEHAGFIIDYKESDTMNIWLVDKNAVFPQVSIPYFDCAHWNSFNKAKANDETLFTNQLGFDEKNKFYKDLFQFIPDLPQEEKRYYFECPGLAISTVLMDDVGLYIENFKGIPYTEEDNKILNRFGRVFQQSYTRYLDLKKAERQAQEAKVEAAIERARSQSMSMQHSDELSLTTQVFHQQLQLLGIDSEFSYLWLPNDDEKTHLFWATWSEGEQEKNHYNTKKVSYPLDKSEPSIAACYTAWESGETVHVNKVKPKEVEDYFNTWTELLGGIDKFQPQLFPDGLYYIDAYMDYGCFGIMIKRQITTDEQNILKRFSKEFQSTYTRFLDLQKAEKQAREAQIEAALEKIRARTIGMQHSDELPVAANDLFKEVKALGINAWSCGYNIFEEDNTSVSCVMSSENMIQAPFHLPLEGEKSFKEWLEAYRNKQDFFVQKLEGKPIKEHYDYLKSLPGIQKATEGLEKAQIPFPEYQVNHLSFFSHGFLLFITYEEVPEAHDLFKRFSKVFEQTYTRFLDLKRAEAQAREARIETALERVRSRSMGMQSTADFGEVTTEMFNQLRGFGEDLFATGIVFCDKHEGHVEQWHSIPGGGMLSPMIVPIDLDYIHQYRYEQWKAGKELFSIEIPSDFIEQHFEDIFKLPSAQITLKDLEARNAPMPEPPPWEIDYGASFNKGYVLISSLKPLENVDILPRFAQVFEQAYTRFLDLQKAEAQAREAQIEAALEKVRSRTLAMQKSSELAETSVVVFKELLALGIKPNRLFIGIIKDNGNTIDAWATNEDGSKIEQQFTLDTSKNESIGKMVEGWRQQKKSIIIDMKGKELQTYFHYLNDVMQIPFIDGLNQERRLQTIAYFSGGFIGMAAPEEQPQETTSLLERFAAVFNLTYTRFNDLKISESQTRKAKIETALERVRARALAMQEPEELKDVAGVLRTEMGNLGIEELETCSIYLLDNKEGDAECWYAIKDDSSADNKLISDHISFDFNKTKVGKKMLDFHQTDDETISIQMKGKERIEWIQYCEQQSTLLKGFYGDDIPERTYHLHKFSNGAIGAASAGDISEESWTLLKRCASVFSLAYSRFKDLTQAKIDLKRLKTEKKRAEDALAELQTTQMQLIQSEKIASLGELTAGIAHEIQNPLNFVNNFSEVSKELLEEMQEEIENGDFEEVKAIMQDIIQNLEKINHHGKRADGIVKGMLQHSRAGGDKKEPTDINALADEYLRLAYHGLRAKDKSFNAELVTDFDKSIKTTKVIPQDIGRVILNLVTNAFYACAERSRSANQNNNEIKSQDYKPTVTVRTKKIKDSIEIEVTDNGNGIPDQVKDKIFQPFFTTKPTGEGTGLGLSMSYDIVTKGHNGNLRFETETGKGTQFIIQLPL
jgi:signal transduction histidine kinase/ketosteroid isomerase-like protein